MNNDVLHNNQSINQFPFPYTPRPLSSVPTQQVLLADKDTEAAAEQGAALF